MQKPDLNQMWETFIRFSVEDVPLGRHVDIIREKVYPVISRLKDENIIYWYCFLIHDRHSGVPTSEDDENPYFHIRFALRRDINPKNFLPDYCVLTRKIEREWVAQISIGKNEVMDTSLFETEEIEEAWRTIGEQSEWLFNMLNIFKKNVTIPLRYVGQFLHYYANMTQLRVG